MSGVVRSRSGVFRCHFRFWVSYGTPIIEHMSDGAGVVDRLGAARVGLAGALRSFDDLLDDGARIDAIRALEDLKNAACAVQAALAVEFARSQRAEQARRGVPVDRVGRGVAEQVALARRESPHAGAIFLGLASILLGEMPHTLHAMSAGVLSEHRARVVVQETTCLTREARAEIDERVCGDLARLETLGTKRLGNLVRGEASRHDPAGVAARLGYAAEQRFVSLRPAPDCMTRLTALLPVAEGVSVLAALIRASDTARATGDPRSRGQVMADELVTRATGQTSPDAIPVALHLIMPATMLLACRADQDPDHGVVDPPGRILGWGPVPEPVARRLVGAAPRLGSWVRRLWAAPSGGLVAMESRRRLFPKGLAEFVTIRDDLCRTPFCDAPIRHLDHITPQADGGSTSAANGQGLCERCNHAKQASGWTARHPHDRPDGDDTDGDPPGSAGTSRRVAQPTHQVTVITPTGHHYPSPDPTTTPASRMGPDTG